MLHAFGDGGVAAPAVDLGPAGDAGLDLMANHVVGNFAFELPDVKRALGARPDDAHIAAQNVPKLRQLVQAPIAQEAAQRRDARIVAHAQPGLLVELFRAGGHRAKFQHAERPAIGADPFLLEKDRAARGELDAERDQQQKRHAQQKRHTREDDVKNPFENPIRKRIRRRKSHAHQRLAGEILNVRARLNEFEKIRHDIRGEALALTNLHDIGGFPDGLYR